MVSSHRGRNTDAPASQENPAGATPENQPGSQSNQPPGTGAGAHADNQGGSGEASGDRRRRRRRRRRRSPAGADGQSGDQAGSIRGQAVARDRQGQGAGQRGRRGGRGGRGRGENQGKRAGGQGGNSALEAKERDAFRELLAIDPLQKINLEGALNDPSLRAIELLTPIGFGQRALIVAPPRSGKTMLLQKLVQAVETNHPEATVLVVLVDERPEEVTEFRRMVEHGQVYASSLDQGAQSHVRMCDEVLREARRLVLDGKDAVIFLDSLTRCARAYNTAGPSSGRTLSGGLDSRTMEKPRELFGAARNVENGGSLTMIATVLVDTGSKMDQVIFEEFKGTGNMELVLDRDLADLSIYPAIDPKASGTRKEEKLRSPQDMARIITLRRVMANLGTRTAMERLIAKIAETESNAALLEVIPLPAHLQSSS